MQRNLDELPTRDTRLKNPIQIPISEFYESKKEFAGTAWGSAINDKCELYRIDGHGMAEVYHVDTMLPKVFVEGLPIFKSHGEGK